MKIQSNDVLKKLKSILSGLEKPINTYLLDGEFSVVTAVHMETGVLSYQSLVIGSEIEEEIKRKIELDNLKEVIDRLTRNPKGDFYGWNIEEGIVVVPYTHELNEHAGPNTFGDVADIVVAHGKNKK